jgi:hypothetical protein
MTSQRNIDSPFYNASGYRDPTAGIAITEADKEVEVPRLIKRKTKRRKRREFKRV